MTAITQIRTAQKASNSWMRDVLLVIGGSLLIALFGRISIPLPFTPVPLVTHFNVCLLLGITLGSKRAAATVLLYIIEGACGLPVFAMGQGGFSVLFGPRGGYIFGYVAAAYLAGYLWEKAKEKNGRVAFGALATGNLVIYCFGVLQLSCFLGFTRALLLGVVPFIIGDFLKLVLSVRLLKWIKG